MTKNLISIQQIPFVLFCKELSFFSVFSAFSLLHASMAPVVPEPGGLGGPLAPPIFGGSVNPIPTGEGILSPPITTGTPNVFHLPASLEKNKNIADFYILHRMFKVIALLTSLPSKLLSSNV